MSSIPNLENIIDPREIIESNLIINDNTCCICYTDISINTFYIIPECNHKFHNNCIISWFRTGNNTCPLCRSGQEINYYTNDYMSRYKFNQNFARRKTAPKQLKRLSVRYTNTNKKLKESNLIYRTWRKSNEGKEWIKINKNYKKLISNIRKYRRSLRCIKNQIVCFPIIHVPVS
jgi:hypothetical protein